MAGSGTYFDLDFALAPLSGYVRKKLALVGGLANAGKALGLRTGDGYLDPSVHPALGLLASTMSAGPHLAALPDGNFEQGLAAWTAALGVSSGTQASTAAVAVDASAGNQVTGANSIKLTTAAATDTAAVTSGLFPCGGSIPLLIYGRAKSSSVAARLLITASFFDRTKTALTSNATAQVFAQTGIPATFAEYGGLLVPPAATVYASVTYRADTAIDSIWIDEGRCLRRPLPVRTSAVLRAARPQFTGNGGTMSAFLADFCGNADGTDGTWEAATVEPEAPIGGLLWGAINSYLTAATTAGPPGLGMTAATAASTLSTIWANALSIIP